MSNIRSLNSQPTFWDFVADFAANNQGPSDANAPHHQRRGHNDWREASHETFVTEDTLVPDHVHDHAEDAEMGGGPEHAEPPRYDDGAGPSAPPPNDKNPPPPPPPGADPHHDEHSRSRSPRGRRHGRRGMRHGGPHSHHHHGGPSDHPSHPHAPGGPGGWGGRHFGGSRGGGGGRGGCPWGRGGMGGGFGRRGPWGAGGWGAHPWAAGFGGGHQGGAFDMEKLAEYFSTAASMFNPHAGGGNPRGARDGEDAGGDEFRPAVDVFDTPAAFVVHASLPGAKKEDVVVHWKADRQELEIAGIVHRPGVDEEMHGMLELAERNVGVFVRAVKLGTQDKPAGVDEEGITAKLEDGVLRVDVPKLKDAEFVQVRRVDVM